VTFGGGDTTATIASRLASAMNGSPVAAAVASGNQVNLTSRTAGLAGNTTLSVSYAWNSGIFVQPSFTATALGVAGGYDAGQFDNSPYRTIYSYDALGNLLQVDQKGSAPNDSTQWRTRTFTYDSLSRLLTATNPESGKITYSYDDDGNLLQKTSPAPNQTGTATQTVSYCYDELHRVTGKGYGVQSCPLATPIVSYAYDSGDNAIGKLTSLTDQAGTASYSYDVLGRLAAETRTLTGANNAAISKNLSYSYNLNGSLKSLTYPSGNVVTYTPDSAGRTLSAIDSGNGINYVTSATYGPDSALTGFVSGNSGTFAGITNAFSYNKRLQPLAMSASAPGQTVFSIGYDFHSGTGTAGSGTDNGNVFGITNYRDQTRNQTFTYDALNRLASARNAGTDCTATVLGGLKKFWGNNYTYDAWGNVIGKSLLQTPAPAACAGENLSVTADAHNWIHATGGADYQYDAAGNMTFNATPPTQNYTYDQENRLTGAAGYAYTYDGDGNRVSKSNGSTGTLYWYMTPGIVGESDLSGNLTDEYVFFNGERVARKSTNGVFYYFSDHLKTASVITDAAGVTKAESDYYPWGGELQFVANDSNHYKFTGKERDETGLDYFGARYYSNGLGRFVTPDWAAKATAVPYAEFADPQSLNLYSYVRNIPTTRYDTDGHCPDGICEDVTKMTPAQLEHKAEVTKQVSIGAGKAVASTVYHAVMQSNPVTAAIDHHTGEPKALQAKNAAQAVGKIVTTGAIAVGGVAVGGVGSASSVATETTTLFRAVNSAEGASIDSLGGFSPSPTGSEFKGFFFEEGDASSFASRMTDMTGDTHTVVSAEAPADLVNASPTHNAATEGSGVLIKNENLPQVKLKGPKSD
jgi:RHS repeat-associated protein